MNRKYILLLSILGSVSQLHTQLITRRSTHADRRNPVMYSPKSFVAEQTIYRNGQPCCPWRYEQVGDYGAAEVHDLRNQLRDQLDSATYQANWQWNQRRINEIQSRLGRIVE